MSSLSKTPLVDSRDFDDIVQEFYQLVPSYLSEWHPQSKDDSGSALVKAFSHILLNVISQLNKVPTKHFIEYLNAMGISLISSRAANTPVQLLLPEDFKKTVYVKSGSQLIGKTDDGEQFFETTKNLLVTPSKIQEVFSHCASKDSLYNFTSNLSNNQKFEIFGDSDSENLQEHSIYFGHIDAFNLKNGSLQIRMEFFTKDDTQRARDVFESTNYDTIWEFWMFDPKTKKTSTITLSAELQDDSSSHQHIAIKLSLSNSIPEYQITESKINDLNSRWLRARLVGQNDAASKIFPMVKHIEVFSSGATERHPLLFYNDQELKQSADRCWFHPFGLTPSRSDCFYIGDDKILSKKGETIDVTFVSNSTSPSLKSETSVEPKRVLHWEYWNGKNWFVFEPTEEIDTNQKKGIAFTCPDDIETTEVNGKKSFWIRLRISSGSFSEILSQTHQINGQNVTIDFPIKSNPPKIKNLEIKLTSSSNGKKLQYCLTKNNLGFINCVDNENNLIPFKLYDVFDEKHSSLYVGFDKKLEKGPFSFYFDLQYNTINYNDSKVKFYYYADGWKKLDVNDETKYVTRSGYVNFLAPPNFSKHDVFGKSLYWLKIVHEPIFTEDDASFPRICDGIYFNAVNASNMQTVNREILGSSDGTANQVFQLKKIPLEDSDVDIWVNETKTLSEQESVTLREENSLKEIKDNDGKVIEQWTRWKSVPSLEKSLPSERHFVASRVSRMLKFGDGINAKIPSRGFENIVCSYSHGGGIKGNFSAMNIDSISGVPFIDKVSNPVPSDGGTDIEDLNRVFSRAPYTIKRRGKLVTSEDFEWMIRENYPMVSKVKCLTSTKSDGTREGGWVTILTVPNSLEKKPAPKLELLKNIEELIKIHSTGMISANRIKVIPPIYVKFSVSVDVFPATIDAGTIAEQKALSSLDSFLHPLSGGPDNHGWDFGQIPCFSDFYALLENIVEIDHVENLAISVTIEGNGSANSPITFQLTENSDTIPEIPVLSLIYGDGHKVVLR